MNLELKKKVVETREKVVGLSQANMLNIDIDQEKDHIEKLTGKKINFPKLLNNASLNSSNPYIASGNMISMEMVDVFIEGLSGYQK